MRLFTRGFYRGFLRIHGQSLGIHGDFTTTPSATLPYYPQKESLISGKEIHPVGLSWSVCEDDPKRVWKWKWNINYTVYPSKFSNFKEGHNDKPINHWFLVSNFQRNLHSQLMCSDSIHSVSPLLGGQVVGVP